VNADHDWVEAPIAATSPRPVGIEAKLTRLEDVQRIRDLMMAYGYLEDARRWDDMLALYTDDVERVLAGSLTETVRGKAALRDRLVTPVMEAKSGRVAASREQVEELGLRHLIFGESIHVDADGRSARAFAQYVLVATRDGETGFARGSHEGAYVFDFRKEDGDWRFSRQQIVTDNAHNPMFAA
jgi:3-phenylpropionate/cinnamic acid dioxygenase small subunit